MEDESPDAILYPAQKFYKSCLNSGKLKVFLSTTTFPYIVVYYKFFIVNNKMNMEYLKSIIHLFGGWPIGKNDHNEKLQSLDWMKVYIYMENNWKISTILDIGLSINFMNTSQYILMVIFVIQSRILIIKISFMFTYVLNYVNVYHIITYEYQCIMCR